MRSFFLVIGIICMTPALVFAQKKVQLQKGAGKLIGGIRNGERIERVIDNVVFVQNNTTIYCDSAWFYRSSNKVEAFGRVRITEGDSITITAARLEYDGNTKQAKLRTKVVFTKLATATLYTDYLDYDRPSNVARYFNGGKLVDSVNVLTSHKGYYNAGSSLASFKKDVKVAHPDYNMTTDSIQYNSRTKEIYFVSETHVVNKDSTSTTYSSGSYNTITKTSDLQQGIAQNRSYELKGNNYALDDTKKIYKIRGDVVMTYKDENLIIYGQATDYNRSAGIAKVYDHAYVAKITSEGDTLFMTADTLVSIDSSDPAKKRLLAYHHVKIFKTDLQGIADSLEYRPADSTLYFYRNPVLWAEDNQLSADSIRVLIEKNTISKIFMVVNAFTISQDTLRNHNQIKGRRMTAEFKDQALNRVIVDGNGESLFYALDDKTATLTGMNKIICSNMVIRFVDKRVNNVSFYVKPEASFIPPHELKEDDKHLAGFEWKEDKRPDKQSVINNAGPTNKPSPSINTEKINPEKKTESKPIVKPEKGRQGKETLPGKPSPKNQRKRPND
jgi:lipopolysaccharide export system protein LptA